jgi:hypothetical protein
LRNFFVGGVVHTELVDLSTDSPLKSSVIYEINYYQIEKQKENECFYSPIGQKEKWFLLQKPQFHNTTIILSVSPA